MLLEQIFYAITTSITLGLAVRTLQFLLSKWVRQYYLLILILVLLLMVVVPPIASYVSIGNWQLESAQRMYWGVSALYQFATFLLLLQLIFRVGRELPAQATLVRTLSLAAIAAVCISVFIHLDKRLNAFMGSVNRDLTFFSALINMVLWRFLLQLRKRDYLLLAVSAGIGIQCTGDAIGLSLRFIGKQMGQAHAFLEFGNILMSLSSVITLLIWHTAFSRSRTTAEKPGRDSVSAPAAAAINPSNSELIGYHE
ncbi:MAG: hypothetical protein HYX27_28160 [Acidobacteria bacterium]|nr:hypothetical protein [Acidobacteriota bacterium]